jgi:hypothetical protein
MPNLAVRVSDVLGAAIARHAAERSAAARALLLLGLAAAGEEMLPLLPEMVAAQRARGLSPELHQALDDLVRQTTGAGARSTPPPAEEPPPKPPDVDAGGYTF